MLTAVSSEVDRPSDVGWCRRKPPSGEVRPRTDPQFHLAPEHGQQLDHRVHRLPAVRRIE